MVKRYDCHWEYGMSIEDDGEWVSYDDYEALQAENARLTEELRKVNSGETISVRFDLSPAAKEGAALSIISATSAGRPVSSPPRARGSDGSV